MKESLEMLMPPKMLGVKLKAPSPDSVCGILLFSLVLRNEITNNKHTFIPLSTSFVLFKIKKKTMEI